MDNLKPAFFDDFANLVQPAITDALQRGDRAVAEEIIETITVTLARIIARTHYPDTTALDQALTRCEDRMLHEATALVGSMNFIKALKAKEAK